MNKERSQILANTFQYKLDWLKQQGQLALLKEPMHGLEKEGLRVLPNGEMAMTSHPKELGSALTHPHITTDYSESLMEFITPVFKESGDALAFLADLHRFSYKKLAENELIWCSSMPCTINNEQEIPIGYYGQSNLGKLKSVYRQGLNYRYGKMMQTIAGIHYNFSINEEFWPVYQKYFNHQGSLQEFRSAGYFTLIRNFRRYSWLLLYLFGASPALSASFMKGKQHQLEKHLEDSLYLPYATSLRMSDLGYSNRAQASLNICFNHLDSYANSLYWAINTPYERYQSIGVKVEGEYRQLNDNILQIENEYYSDIRPKRVAQSGEKPIHALMSRGVEYVEVRNTDINPLLPLGIDQTQSDFLDLFLITCLLDGEQDIEGPECEMISENHQKVVTRGREPGLMLTKEGQQITLCNWAEEILNRTEHIAKELDALSSQSRYTDCVAEQCAKVLDSTLTPSAKILRMMQENKQEYVEFSLQQSRLHRETLLKTTLAAEQDSLFQQEALNSIKKQSQLEASSLEPFDEYLAHYLAQ